MANPTTYFGWVMPTATDLVTDLPADFNVFGQGVDTSMQDLLGGTTGQVLSKTSNTNMDFTWVTPTDATPLTTKGDLFTFTTVDARLGVGTNDQVLVADSAQATGLKWATLATGSTFVGASCYTTVQLTVPNGTDTAITYNSEFYDTDSFHSTATNTSRFTIPAGKSGKYLCAVSIQSDGSASEMGAFLKIYKNGSFFTGTKKVIRGGSEPMNTDFSQVIDLTATDYIQFYIYQNSGASRNFFSENALAGAGYGQITYLGA